MNIEYQFVPYKSVGEYYFGMKRFEIKSVLGEPFSSYMYGYPVEDRFLDDYGFFHTLCSNKSELEAIELFPDVLTDNVIVLSYDDKIITLSKDVKITLDEFRKVTDDFLWHDDEEGYSSAKLGVKIYCPNGYIEDVIIHDLHCYDEEERYLKELAENEY